MILAQTKAKTLRKNKQIVEGSDGIDGMSVDQGSTDFGPTGTTDDGTGGVQDTSTGTTVEITPVVFEPYDKRVTEQIEAFSTFVETCSGKIETYEQLDAQRDELVSGQERISQELIDNEEQLKQLQEGRCEANLLFIDALKEHKIAIEVVEFLIQFLGEYDFSLLQTNAFAKVHASLIAVATLSDSEGQRMAQEITDKLALLQTSEVETTSSQRISNLYDMMGSSATSLENLKELRMEQKVFMKEVVEEEPAEGVLEKLEMAEDKLSEDAQAAEKIDFDNLQDDLLGLLEDLRVHLVKSMEDLINREVAANVAFAEFKIMVEAENEKFEKQLVMMQEMIDELVIKMGQTNLDPDVNCFEDWVVDTAVVLEDYAEYITGFRLPGDENAVATV